MIGSDSESLFDLLPLFPELAVLATDSDGVVNFANLRARELLHLTEAQIGSCNILNLLASTPDVVPGSVDNLALAARDGLIIQLHFPAKQYVLLRAVQMSHAASQYVFSLVDTRDPSGADPCPGLPIACSTNNPDALLKVAEEISEFGCFSWDMVEDTLEWSDGLIRIFGVKREDFTRRGEEFFNRIHPQDHWKIREALARAAGNDGHFECTERILRPNGDIRWLQSQGRLQSGPDGSAVHLVGICRDITEKIQNDQDLRTQIDERKDLESQLLQTQKLEAIGKLSSGIAHDFNNLLTVISSGCDFLKMLPAEAMREDARSLVDSIQDAGDRASQLTRQLLLYSRSSAGQPRAVHLNAAVEYSKKILTRILSKDVDFSLELLAHDAILHIDPTQLQQILLNLAMNAKEAMPDGGQLRIRTDVVLKDPASASDTRQIRYALLQVIDSGTGVSCETRLRMFDPFYTTKPIGEGSGLGLSVVWGIVHAAGGMVEVDSEPGQYTELRVYLPICPDQEVEPVTAPRASAAPGRQSILVVDDEKAVLDIVTAALRHAGFQVIAISDPAEAIRLAADPATRIDLLVSDVSMPTLSGPEMLRSIRGVRPSSEFPVLFISGNDEYVLAKKHGIDVEEQNFLQKPFRIAALIGKVEDLISG